MINNKQNRHIYMCEAQGKLNAIQYMFDMNNDMEREKYCKYVSLLEEFYEKIEESQVLD